MGRTEDYTGRAFPGITVHITNCAACREGTERLLAALGQIEGDVEKYGMLGWYISYVAPKPELRQSSAIGRWFNAARQALSTG